MSERVERPLAAVAVGAVAIPHDPGRAGHDEGRHEPGDHVINCDPATTASSEAAEATASPRERERPDRKRLGQRTAARAPPAATPSSAAQGSTGCSAIQAATTYGGGSGLLEGSRRCLPGTGRGSSSFHHLWLGRAELASTDAEVPREGLGDSIRPCRTCRHTSEIVQLMRWRRYTPWVGRQPGPVRQSWSHALKPRRAAHDGRTARKPRRSCPRGEGRPFLRQPGERPRGRGRRRRLLQVLDLR